MVIAGPITDAVQVQGVFRRHFFLICLSKVLFYCKKSDQKKTLLFPTVCFFSLFLVLSFLLSSFFVHLCVIIIIYFLAGENWPRWMLHNSDGEKHVSQQE